MVEKQEGNFCDIWKLAEDEDNKNLECKNFYGKLILMLASLSTFSQNF